MFVTLTLSFFLAGAPGGSIAPADTTVTIPFHRTTGDRYEMSIEKVREEYETEAGRLVLVDRIRHEWLMRAEVRGRRPGGYSLAWMYEPLTSPDTTGQPTFEPETGTLSNVRIVFAADERGKPRFVLNPLWVRQRLLSAIDRAAPGATQDQLIRMETIRNRGATHDGLSSVVLSDPERVYLLSGRTLTERSTVTEGTWIENPFGDGLIAAEEIVRLDSLSRDGLRAHITWRMLPDPQDLASVVLQLLEGFSPGVVDADLQSLAEQFDVRESATFEIDMERGMVLAARFERRLSAADRVRLEESRYTAVVTDES